MLIVVMLDQDLFKWPTNIKKRRTFLTVHPHSLSLFHSLSLLLSLSRYLSPPFSLHSSLSLSLSPSLSLRLDGVIGWIVKVSVLIYSNHVSKNLAFWH